MKSLISYRKSILCFFLLALSYGVLAQNEHVGEWRSLEDSSHPRVEAVSATVNDIIYIFSGFTSFEPIDEDGNHQLLITASAELFDFATIDSEEGPWKEIVPIPIAITHSMAVAVENDIWIAGGFAGNDPGISIDDVQIYHTESGTWSEGPHLPEPMASHGIARVGNQIHIFGGLKPDRVTDNEAHYFLDLDNQELGWLTAAPFPKARNHFGTTTLEGKIYAIGGQHGHDKGWEDLPYLHVYDPISDTWEALADLPTNRSHFEPSTIMIDGKILVAGGRNQHHHDVLDDVIEYNPVENTWQQVDLLPKRMLAPVAKIVKNQFFVSHGGFTWSSPYNTAYVKDYDLNETDVLGFWPEEVHLELDKNESKSTKTLLWTHTKSTPYNINITDFPSWIKVDETYLNSITDPKATRINLTVDTEGLEPGEYSYVVAANAQGYDDAGFVLNILVNETDEPEAPDNHDPQDPVDPITNINDPKTKSPSINVFPNPNHGKSMYLEITGITSKDLIEIRVFDTLGRLVYENMQNTDYEGNFSYELQMPVLLNPGIYTLTASSRSENLKKKLVIK